MIESQSKNRLGEISQHLNIKLSLEARGPIRERDSSLSMRELPKSPPLGQIVQFKIFSVRAIRKFDITRKAPSYEPAWAPELTIMRYQMPRNIYSGNQFVKNLISRFQNSQKPLTRSRSRVAQG